MAKRKRTNPGAKWHGKQVREISDYMRRYGASDLTAGARNAHIQSARASKAQGILNPKMRTRRPRQTKILGIPVMTVAIVGGLAWWWWLRNQPRPI